jgi:hypothetical protein
MGVFRMNIHLHHYVCRSVLAGLIVLAGMQIHLDSNSIARASDHPVPSDTSTRKGVVASEESQCQDESQQAIESTTSKPKSEKSSQSQATKDSNLQANVTLAQWVSDWMKNPRKFTARLAIHGVVPEIELQAVIPAAQQRICANGKCYEVDEKVVEGKPCDEPMPSDKDSRDEPIVEAPVAPPIPPSFPFAFQGQQEDTSIFEFQIEGSPRALGYMNQDTTEAGNEIRDVYGSLSQVQVTVPASTLVAYLVAHAENSVRLEMTEQLAAERAMYAQRYELLLQHNQQLQTQLAVLEARHRTDESLAMRVDPTTQAEQEDRCKSLTASKEDWDSIQEDLSNIRRQIANLKNSSPIPFAQSNIGTQAENPSRQPQAWRTARSIPYVPVFPSAGKTTNTNRK